MRQENLENALDNFVNSRYNNSVSSIITGPNSLIYFDGEGAPIVELIISQNGFGELVVREEKLEKYKVEFIKENKMHLYLHKDRYVVVSNEEVSTETGGEVRVAFVALAPTVENKRGRRPDYAKNAVPAAELRAISETELGETLTTLAREVATSLN